MGTLVNKILSKYLARIYKANQSVLLSPHAAQRKILMNLIDTHSNTAWGKKYGFEGIKSPADYVRSVPVQRYETLKPFIERMMGGERDVLCAGLVEWFAKSSGTTSAVSKYLPVTKESLNENHIKSAWTTLAFLYKNNPNSNVFAHKSLLLGGTFYSEEHFDNIRVGDISALLFQYMPPITRKFFLAHPDIAAMPNIEKKILLMSELMQKEDICMIGGVPTWTYIFIQNVLKISGKDNIFDVWPNLETYIHGGVNFEPHRKQFEQYFSSKHDFYYQEIYNASEGFFAAQDNLTDKSLQLMMDCGVYYEFLPKSEWTAENPQAIQLQDVELGEEYALVITTSAGLWRYAVGDTVQFITLTPHKFYITGRTSLFVNAFGEEVILSNTDKAITQACDEFDAILNDYTLGPIYFDNGNKGGHEWIIEFEKAPVCLETFAERLDHNLQKLNSDYQQKRFNSLALERLRIHSVPAGTFNEWLKAKGKYGGQNKVPRLSNNRDVVDEILEFSGINA